MSRIEEVLRRIVEDLGRTAHPFALVGGFAVSARTEPRFTRDVDLVVGVEDDAAAEALLGDLAARGYTTVTTIEQLVTRRLAAARLVSPAGQDDQLIVDLLFASSGVEPEIAVRAESLQLLEDLIVPVARTGDLLALKLLARDDAQRPQDGGDLHALRAFANADDLALARNTATLITARGYAGGRDLIAALDLLIAGG